MCVKRARGHVIYTRAVPRLLKGVGWCVPHPTGLSMRHIPSASTASEIVGRDRPRASEQRSFLILSAIRCVRRKEGPCVSPPRVVHSPGRQGYCTKLVCVASYGEVTGISRHPACLSAPREAPQQRVSGSHLDQLRNSSGSHCRPNIGRPTVYPGRP